MTVTAYPAFRYQRLAATALAAALLGGCAVLPGVDNVFEPADGAPPYPADVSAIPDAVPRPEPRSAYGNPLFYVVEDNRYEVLGDSRGFVQRGIASWYGTKFHGRRTSSGEPYDMYAMTAAHPTLPLPTYAAIRNLENGRTVVVKINDRGPFKKNRVIDLSYAAAARLGIMETGTGLVEIVALDPSEPARGAPAAHPAAEETHLYLQLGAFVNRDNAEQLQSRARGIVAGGIHVVPAAEAERVIYRVRIGPLSDVDAADRISEELLAAGLGPPRIVID